MKILLKPMITKAFTSLTDNKAITCHLCSGWRTIFYYKLFSVSMQGFMTVGFLKNAGVQVTRLPTIQQVG